MQRTHSTFLQNRHLAAGFSADGALAHLASSERDPSLIARTSRGYFECESRRWYGDTNETTNAPISMVRCHSTSSSLTSVHRSEHIEWSIHYELPEKSPFLLVAVCLRTTGHAGRLLHPSLPRFTFTPDFNDVFEDERDLYSDGAELGNGRELPCWRVFFQRGRRTGLMLATRSKRDMGRFNILANGFEATPNQFCNYTTTTLPDRPALDASKRSVFEQRFEIGPWTSVNHSRLLRLARLDQPRSVIQPLARGKPKARLKGKVFFALRFAGPSMRPTYSRRAWMLAKMPWAQKGRALVAGCGVRPPALRLDPKLKGIYRVFVGIGNGDGIALRLSGDPETTIRNARFENDRQETPLPFTLFLTGRHRAQEVSYGIARMDGRTVRIERFPNTFGTTVLDYMRFEKLPPAQARAWETTGQRQPRINLSGFNDIPDIAQFTDVDDPDPAAYHANIWEHARCGFQRIYWRVDGQCSDFPSRHNTMRYVSARVHGVFHPPAKAYGRVLKKTNMLALAVEAAKTYGVELYGWMRFNNYSGNVQSEFYKQNPQWWEEWESGNRGPKLCLAIPEVRAHKIAILVEAAGHGLQGLNLGFLRHPPILMFHPALVESYRQKYGTLPPRVAHRPDARFIDSLPPSDEEHTRWYQHRAGYMTMFGVELRAALKARGLAHVKVSIWVRPNHCVFDGIDLPAWLDRGLCDEVVVNGVIGPELCYSNAYDVGVCGVRDDWKQMVRAKVPLIRCLAFQEIARWQRDLPRADIDGYDGLCTYESDWSVLDSDFIEFYRSLRR